MDQQKQSPLCHIYPPLASTERGRSIRIAASKTQLVYCVSNIVVVRSLEDLSFCTIFDQHKYDTTAVKISPNGNHCCSGDSQGNMMIWELKSKGHPIFKQYERILGGPIRDISWTGDGERIIVVGEGQTQFGRAILLSTGSNVGEIGAVAKSLLTCDARPQRPFRVIAGGEEFTINWYEGPPFKFKKSSKEHQNYLNCARFSQNGDYFVTGSSDKKLFLYDGKTGDFVKEIKADLNHTRSITEISWVNETHFVTSSNDTTLKLWNLDGLVKTFLIPESEEIGDMQTSIVFANRNCYSVSLNGVLNVYKNILELNDGSGPSERYHGHIGGVTSMEVSNDILITGDQNGKILFWQNRIAQPIIGKQHSNKIVGLSISMNKDKIFSLGGQELKMTNIVNRQIEKSAECKGQIIDVVSSKVNDDMCYVLLGNGDIIQMTNLETTNVIKLGYDVTSFDIGQEDIMVVGDLKGYLHIIQGGTEIDKLQLNQTKITAIKIENNKLICGDSTGKMKLFDLNTKQEIYGAKWTYHTTIISALSFTDGYAISCGQDNRIMIWDLNNGLRIGEYVDSHKRGVLCLCVYDNYIISSGGDCTIKQWNILKQ